MRASDDAQIAALAVLGIDPNEGPVWRRGLSRHHTE